MLAFDQTATFALQLDITGIDTTAINIIGSTKEGIFKFRVVPTGAGTMESFTFGIPDIPVFVSAFSTVDTMDRGEVWAVLWLTINGERVWKLASGYMTFQNPLTFPNTHSETEQDTRGFFAKVTGTNQAAGAENTDPVPTNETWILKSYIVSLVTDATAPLRNVHLIVTPHNSTINLHSFGNVTQAASLTRTWHFAPYGYLPTAADNEVILVPIPPDIVIVEGGTIGTETLGFVAGDNFGAPAIAVEKFMRA